MMRLTQRGADSFSQNSKSMTKFSDNGSEGSYHPKNVEKYKTTKQSQLVPQNSGGLNDLKIENSKNHTFASDLEDSPSIQGLTGTNLVRINKSYIDNLAITSTNLHAKQEGLEEKEQWCECFSPEFKFKHSQQQYGRRICRPRCHKP